MTTRLCDLPHELVGAKILTKVPLTSLRQVRSTCKLWDGLSKDWIVGKAAARQHQFLGFMLTDNKVCSLRFHLRRSKQEEEDVVDLDVSREKVDLFSQVEIVKVLHCDGLLLCVTEDNSKLAVWNPYLGQKRWISPITYTCLDTHVNYAVGYDMNRNHKILRYLDFPTYEDGKHLFVFEIYDLPSDSWRVLEVITPDWRLEYSHRGGVSLKGNTYFWAHHKEGENEPFLLCFDFTTERFGQPLYLPFHSFGEDSVSISSVRDEKLALLHHKGEETMEAIEIWTSTKTEPDAVTWSKFMNVDMRPLIGDGGVWFDAGNGSFFIDEEKKVVVVFDLDGHDSEDEEGTQTPRHHTAFIIGDDGYYKTVSLGVSTWQRCPHPPQVCSFSYLPSLVQLNQTRKRKKRDEF